MSNEEIKFLAHDNDFDNSRFNSCVFIDLRPENKHQIIEERYNHFISGKLICHSKLIHISYSFLDVLSDKYSYLAYGIDRETAINYLSKKYSKIDFKEKRIAILVFKKLDKPKNVVEQLKLL